MAIAERADCFTAKTRSGKGACVFLRYLDGPVPVWHSSSCDLGIYDAAYTHSCAAAPNCTLPSDILGYLRKDDLVVTPIEIKDSYAIVPQTPGLGVELDEEAAKKYRCA